MWGSVRVVMTDEFCPVLTQMLAENKTVGRSGKQFTGLASNSTINNLRFIQKTMRERKPERTLEVGLAFGASTLVFCSEHDRLGHEASKQHTAIDPIQPYQLYDEAGVYAVERAGLVSFLDYHPEYSEFALPRLLGEGRRYDFIYIDGSHLFENVLIDAFYCAKLLTDGGLIAFDDCADPHVAKVITFIRSNLSRSLKEILPNDFKSSAARLLGKRQLATFERLPYQGPHQPRSFDTPLRDWDSKLGKF
jgi:predicted O-methyltransferase YrrM